MSKKSCDECKKTHYCKQCGQPLTLSIRVYQPYDIETGEKENFHYHYWTCPNALHPIINMLFGNHSIWNDVPYDVV